MNSKTEWPRWLRWIAIGSVVAAWAILALIVILPYFVSPESRTDINEQLLQVILWSITIVFTTAGALLGLNWYQGDQKDKEQKEQWGLIKRDAERQLQAMKVDVLDIRNKYENLLGDVEFVKGQIEIISASSGGLSMATRLLSTEEAQSRATEIIDTIKSLSNALKSDSTGKALADHSEGISAIPDLVWEAREFPLEVQDRFLDEMQKLFYEDDILAPEIKSAADTPLGALLRSQRIRREGYPAKHLTPYSTPDPPRAGHRAG